MLSPARTTLLRQISSKLASCAGPFRACAKLRSRAARAWQRQALAASPEPNGALPHLQRLTFLTTADIRARVAAPAGRILVSCGAPHARYTRCGRASGSIMNANWAGSYRHRLVAPDLPSASDYLPLLEEIDRNGWYSNFGPLARRFEAALLKKFGAPDETCVTCCNATAGLSAALLATGRTGRVLLPAFTFAASLGALRAAGMTPLVVDGDADEWTLGGALLDRALAETAASIVMLVAPFGIRRKMEAAVDICRKRGAAV